MPMTLHDEGGNVFRVEVRGRLRKADLDRGQNALAAEINRLGPVKLLFVLEGFDGWEPADNWSDLSFYVKHGDTIQRIAIVGDERWRSEALMFAGADCGKRLWSSFQAMPLRTRVPGSPRDPLLNRRSDTSNNRHCTCEPASPGAFRAGAGDHLTPRGSLPP